MATIWEVPLVPHAQKVRVAIGGIFYTLHLKYNSVCDCWMMDINDTSDAIPIVHGVAVVTGTDLMGQFRYLGIGGGLPMTVMTTGVGRSPDEIPDYYNLGVDGRLFFMTEV